MNCISLLGRRIVRRAGLVLVTGCAAFSGIGPAQAQTPTSADVDALRLAASDMAGAFGVESPVELTQTSLDLIFVFEELEKLQANGALVGDACGGDDSTLDRLADPTCLAALFDAERRVWRLGAELAERLHLLASKDVAARIELPEGTTSTDQEREVQAWWADAGLTALEAVARIGREWMKFEGDEAQRAATLQGMEPALRQIGLEPAVVHLFRALVEDESGLHRSLQIVLDDGVSVEERAEAAREFAVIYARLQAEAMRARFGVEMTPQACLDLVSQDLAGDGSEGMCVEAMNRMREAAAEVMSDPEYAFGNFDVVAARLDDARTDPEAFVASLTETFLGRQMTFRLLLGKAVELQDVSDCGAAIAMMAARTEPFEGNFDLADDLRPAISNLSRVVGYCLRDAAAEQIIGLCEAAAPIIHAGSGEIEDAVLRLPQTLPVAVRDALNQPWSSFVRAVGVRDLSTLCSDLLKLSAAEFATRLDGYGNDVRQAFDALSTASQEALARAAVDEAFAALDRIEVPVAVQQGLRTALTGICRLTATGSAEEAATGGAATEGDEPSIRALIADAIRRDLGLSDAAALGKVCERVRRGEDILALADVEEAAEETAEIVDAAKAVRDALSQMEDRAADIAAKVATVAVILETAAAIDGVMPLDDDGCGPTAPAEPDGSALGLELGFASDGLTSSLAVADGGIWTITLSSTLKVAICGVQAADDAEQNDVQQIVTLAEVSVGFSEPVEVTASTTAESVAEQLRKAMRRAVRDARIDAIQLNPYTLQRVARAAGLNLDALQALQFGPLQAVSLTPGDGLRFDLLFPDPFNTRLSFCVPMGEPVDGCHTFDQAGEVLLDLLRTVAERELRALIQGLVEDANDELAETLLHDAEMSLVGNRLLLTLPSRFLEQRLPELIGDFTISFALSDQGIRTEVRLPTLDVVALVNREFGALDGMLRIEIVAEPADWANNNLPEGLRSALLFADTGTCVSGYAAQLKLAPGAPLVGTIGYVCLTERGEDPTFVPGTNVELTTPDGNWTLELNGQNPSVDGARDIAIRITSTAPLFTDVKDLRALLRVDLAAGTFVLPSDAEDNAELYRLIETVLNDRMPAGVRIYGLELSREGITISVDPSEAIEREFFPLVDAVGAELEQWGVWAGKVEEMACSSVGEIYRLGEVLQSGILPEIPPGCENRDADRGTIAIRAAEVSWRCRGSTGVGGQVTDCRIDLPEEILICGQNLSVDVTWRLDRKREVTSRDLVDCVRERLESLLPLETLGVGRFSDIALDFDGSCVGSQVPADCAVTVTATVDLSRLTDDAIGVLPEECTAFGGVAVTARLTLDGTLNAVTSGEADLRSGLRRCGDALVEQAAAAALQTLDEELGNLEFYVAMAGAGKAILGELQSAFASVADGGIVECGLVGKDGRACDSLEEEDLREGTITGARIAVPISVLGQSLRLYVDLAWGRLDFEAGELLGIADEDALRDLIRSKWGGLSDGSDLRVSVDCEGRGDCLNGFADSIAKSVASDILHYADGTATLTQANSVLTLTLPFEVKIPEIGLEAPLIARCELDFSDIGELKLPDCIAAVSNDFLLQAMVEVVKTALPQGHSFDLGIATVSVSGEPALEAGAGRIRVPLSVSLADYVPTQTVNSALLIDRNLNVQIEPPDYGALADKMIETLTGSVNELTGDLGVKITAIDPMTDDENKLTRLEISSEIAIPNLFSITAPTVILDKDGLHIDGPNRFGISFEEVAQILVPPFAICPTGGEIVDTQITVTASVTLVECTSRYLVNYRGSLTFDFENPTRLTTQGSLTLLNMIPLGTNSGEMDIAQPYFQQAADLGGALSDIISLASLYQIEGADPVQVSAQGDLRVFRTPVGQGDLLLDLGEQRLDASVVWDVVIASGQGAVRTQERFSRPEAVATTQMDVGGFSAFRADFLARPNLLRLRLNVLGIRLAVVFPGLDKLDGGLIADLIRDLLTPDFENLDEALAALLSGNITMNPMSDFGDGDGGMGDSDDGADDGGADDGGAGDPGEGLADGPAPEPVQGARGPDPVGGTPGLIGVTAVDVRFELLEGGDPEVGIVQISVGVPGAHDERLLARARIEPEHFAEDGQPSGQLLSVLPTGYSQLLQATGVSCGEEQPAGAGATGQVVYLYTGDTEPRRGFYELCRMTTADGTALDIEGLDPQAKRDLSAFHETLIAEMQARGPVDGGDYGRLMLRGRMIDEDGLHGVIGFQRPGELLVVMTGSLADSACGTTPGSGGQERTRQFWLTGTTVADLNDTARVLAAVRALWNCGTGTLGRIDTDRLTTATSVSVQGEDGSFTTVARLQIDCLGPGCAGARLPAPEPQPAPEPSLPDPQVETFCSGDCEQGAIVIADYRPGTCQVQANGMSPGYFPVAALGTGACRGDPLTTKVTVAPGIRMVALVQHDSASTILLATPSGWRRTDILPTFNSEELVAAQWHMVDRFMSEFLVTFEGEGFIEDARHIQHGPTLEALGAPIAENQGTWVVRYGEEVHRFTQTGDWLDEERAKAALPAFTGEVASAAYDSVSERLFVDRGTELRVYQWVSSDGEWRNVARVTRASYVPLSGQQEARPTRADVAADLLDRLMADGTPVTPYVIRVLPIEPGSDSWAYAWDNGTEGGLVVRQIRRTPITVDGVVELSPSRIVTQMPASSVSKGSYLIQLNVEGGEHYTFNAIRIDGSSQPSLSPFCLFSRYGEFIAQSQQPPGSPIGSTVSWTAGENDSVFFVKFIDELSISTSELVRAVLFASPTSLGPLDEPVSTCAVIPNDRPADFFSEDPSNVVLVPVKNLSLILNNDWKLEILARALREERHGQHNLFSPVLSEPTNMDQPVYVASEYPGTGQLVFRTLDNEGLLPLAAFNADPPPQHAWPRLADGVVEWRLEEAVTLHAEIEPITGTEVNLGDGLAEAWQAVLPGTDGDTLSVHYRAGEESRVIQITAAAGAGSDLVARAARYMIDAGVDKLVVLLSDIERNLLIVRTETGDCWAESRGCAERLVALTAKNDPVGIDLALRQQPQQVVATIAELFALVVQNTSRPFEGLPQQLASDGPRVLGLSQDGPLHVVLENGHWACLQSDLQPGYLADQLSAWPEDLALSREDPGLCGDSDVPVWSIALSDGQGLLFPSDPGPLHLRSLAEGGAGLADPQGLTLSADLQRLLADRLVEELALGGDFSLAPEFPGQTPIIQVAGGRHRLWVAGADVALSDGNLACLLGDIRATLPENVGDGLEDKLAETVREIVRAGRETLFLAKVCSATTRTTLQVVPRGNDWDVWYRQTDAAADLPRQLPGGPVTGPQRNSTRAKLNTGMEDGEPQTVLWRLPGIGTLSLDMRAQDAVRETAMRAVRNLMEHRPGEPGEWEITLLCGDETCETLVGEIATGRPVALVQNGWAVAFDVTLGGTEEAKAFAGAVAKSLGDCTNDPCAAWFEARLTDFAAVAAGGAQRVVLWLKSSDSEVHELGLLPADLAGEGVDAVLRHRLLDEIAAEGESFTITPLAREGEVARAVLAFEQPDAVLFEQRVMRSNGSDGPTFWTENPALNEQELGVINGWIAANSRLAHDIWMPRAGGLFSLSRAPTDRLTLAARLSDNALVDLQFREGCDLPLATGANFAAGLNRLAGINQALCTERDGRTILRPVGDSRALVAAETGHAVLTLDREICGDEDTVLAALAEPALVDRSDVAVYREEGLMLAATGEQTSRLWRLACSQPWAALIIGDFKGLDMTDPDHRRLAADLSPDREVTGRFESIGDRKAVRFGTKDEAFLNVVAGSETAEPIAHFAFVHQTDGDSDVDYALDAFLDLRRATDGFLDPVGDRLMIFAQSGEEHLSGMWVGEENGSVAEVARWPADLPAAEVFWLSDFLSGPVAAGHALQAVFKRADVTVSCSETVEGERRLAVALKETVHRDADGGLPLLLHGHCGQLDDERVASLVSGATDGRLAEQKLEFHPGDQVRPDLVLAAANGAARASGLWTTGTDGSQLLCETDIPWKADVTEALGAWLATLQRCDWALIDRSGELALAQSAGSAVLIGPANVRRPIESVDALSENRDRIFGWFASDHPIECDGTPIKLHTSRTVLLLDDPCAYLARADDEADFVWFASRQGGTPLSDDLYNQLASLPAGNQEPALLLLQRSDGFGVVIQSEDGQQALLLDGSRCGWLTAGDELTVGGILNEIGDRVWASAFSNHQLFLSVQLSGLERTITISGERPMDVCDIMNANVLPAVRVEQEGWSFRGVSQDGVWHELREVGLADIGEARKSLSMATFIAAQLRDDVQAVHLWRSNGTLFVIQTDEGICLRLLNRDVKDGQAAAMVDAGRFADVGGQLGHPSFSLIEFARDMMPKLDLSEPNPRWYEPLIADPRGLLMEMEESEASCL